MRTTRTALCGALLLCATALAQDISPQDYFFQPVPSLMQPAGLELLFGPKDDIEARIIRAIDAAKNEVLVNHYVFTDERIMDALQRAFDRKCVVMVLLDASPAIRDYRAFEKLRARHIPVVPVHCAEGWNNSKYILVDRAQVLTGTADLTNSATRNDEQLIVMSEPSVVITYYNHFVATAFPSSTRTSP